MLKGMRAGAKNIFVKAFLALLALSFVVWGVGDVFRGRTSDAVVIIGDNAISYSEYNRALQSVIENYRQMTGRNFSEEELDRFGVKKNILNGLINDKIIRVRMEELNFIVGDKVAQEKITSKQEFFNESGTFDKEIFAALLKRQGINKNDYVESLKIDVAVEMFLDTLMLHPASMNVLADPLYKYRNEEKTVDLLSIPADFIKEAASPSETELLQYYQEHTEQFSVPELREVTYITFDVKNVANELSISDSELRSEYEANIDSYLEPEQREVDQYLFSTQEEAQKAFDSLGQDRFAPYESAKISLGKVSEFGIPENVKDVVFAMPLKGVSKPLKTQLGWHVFIVNKIYSARTRSFEEVKEQLEEDLRAERGSELFLEFANSIEDEFASGMSLEEVSKKFDIVIHKIPAIDSNGRGANGKDIAGIEGKEETFIQLSFTTEAGTESALTLLPDNETYLVLRVDSVTPIRVKALDEVKGNLIVQWQEQNKQDQLHELAVQIATKLQSGDDINKLAKGRFKIKKNKTLSRPDDGSYADVDGIPVALISNVFTLEPNGTTEAYRSTTGNYMIAKLRGTENAQEDLEKHRKLHKELKNSFADDISIQYSNFLRKEYDISVNESLLNAPSY